MNNIRTSDPLLICFCGPAASGKSTISRAIVERTPTCALSVSTTTRPPRDGEEEGKHYYFTDSADFEGKLEAGLFAEHTQFGEHYYGTGKENIDRALAVGQHLLFDIESHGVKLLRDHYGARVVCIFLFPPSFRLLAERLRQRATDTPEHVEFRLKNASDEIQALSEPGMADYFVVNDEFERCLKQVEAIILAESLKFSIQHPEFLAEVFRE